MLPSVAITAVRTAVPQFEVESARAADLIGRAVGETRLAAAIARASGIERRATALPSEVLAKLGTITARNEVYKQVAPVLAAEVTAQLLPTVQLPPGSYVSSSCTGYMVPGWDGLIATQLELPDDLVRLPITQAGCAGGLLAIAQAADFVRLHPNRSALAVSVELCSLAFHADPQQGNLVSALLFGDGAGGAVLEASANGIEVLEHRSAVVPNSREALGFDLTDQGFYPRLSLDLADLLVEPFCRSLSRLLAESEVALSDLSYFLIHPGGPRILDRLQSALNIPDEQLRWSRESLRNRGNMSSAAIFDVLHRFLEDPGAPTGTGVMAAFGPGVSIELLLVRRCA